ncbi:MAG: nucleotidyltransferase domain-containing protein, partial [Anaerolineales bacterium]
MDFDLTLLKGYFEQPGIPYKYVHAAYLFGSLARGQGTPQSDV